MLVDKLLLADLLLRLRSGNLLLLQHLNLIFIVAQLLTLNHLLLDDLCHLDRHPINAFRVALDVPLLLLVVPRGTEDACYVLTCLDSVLRILCLTDF